MAGLLIWIVVVALFLTGVAGTIIPAVPGIGLIWLGVAIYAWATGFQEVSGGAVLALGIISLLVSGASYAGGMLAAKAAGSRRAAIFGTVVGALLGMAVASVVGLLLGGFTGALVGAFWETRRAGMAVRTATITVIGILLGTALQFLVGMSMVVGFFLTIWIRG